MATARPRESGRANTHSQNMTQQAKQLTSSTGMRHKPCLVLGHREHCQHVPQVSVRGCNVLQPLPHDRAVPLNQLLLAQQAGGRGEGVVSHGGSGSVPRPPFQQHQQDHSPLRRPKGQGTPIQPEAHTGYREGSRREGGGKIG